MILNVSPNAYHPPHEGASVRSWKLATYLQMNGYSSSYLAKNFFYPDLSNEECYLSREYSEHSKKFYAAKSLLFFEHYNRTKHVDRLWQGFAAHSLKGQKPKAIFAHFVFSIPWCLKNYPGVPLIVDTHNSEWEWFNTLANASKNPFLKIACAISKKRALDFIRMLPAGSVMTHVRQHDAEDFKAKRPDLQHLVIENGMDCSPRSVLPNYKDAKKKLIFFSSLSGQMNIDSLRYFGAEFWPQLSPFCELIVAGAKPGAAAREIVNRYGWSLKPDLSDEEIDSLFHEAHFAILPFEYGAGSKHKYLASVGRGIPTLATEHGLCGQKLIPSYVTVSNNPEVWKQIVLKIQSYDPSWEIEAHHFIDQMSWNRSAVKLASILDSLGIKA